MNKKKKKKKQESLKKSVVGRCNIYLFIRYVYSLDFICYTLQIAKKFFYKEREREYIQNKAEMKNYFND